VPPWIYVALLHCFGRNHDLDAVLSLAHDLHDQRVDIPTSTWSYLLKISLQHRHVHLAEWIWYKQVAPYFLIPDATTCRDVVQLAAVSLVNGQSAARARCLQLVQSALVALDNISPDMAMSMRKHLSDSFEAAGLKPTRAMEEAASRQSMFTVFAGNLSESYIDPRSALSARPAGKFRGLGRLRRKAQFEGKS
jgi:hypothetical protein